MRFAWFRPFLSFSLSRSAEMHQVESSYWMTIGHRCPKRKEKGIDAIRMTEASRLMSAPNLKPRTCKIPSFFFCLWLDLLVRTEGKRWKERFGAYRKRKSLKREQESKEPPPRFGSTVLVHGCTHPRWWFQILFFFIPTWGNDPIWLIFFKWVEATNQHQYYISYQLSWKSPEN